MALGNRVNEIGKKYEWMIAERAVEVYEKITGVSKEEIRKAVTKDILTKEKEFKEKWKEFPTEYKWKEYLNEETEKQFYKLANKFLELNNYILDVKEDIKDGKDIIIYRLLKIVKEYNSVIDFDYNLEVKTTTEGRTILEGNIKQVKAESKVESKIKSKAEVKKAENITN